MFRVILLRSTKVMTRPLHEVLRCVVEVVFGFAFDFFIANRFNSFPNFVKRANNIDTIWAIRIRDRKRVELSNNSIRFSRIESNRILNLKSGPNRIESNTD